MKIIDDSLNFKITKIGNSKPKVTVICGVHGDEHSPRLIVEDLKKLDVIKGQIEIIENINSKAIKENKRFIEKDLNRCFPGNKEGCLEEKINAKLNEVIDCDLIVDLHCFHSNTKLTSIHFDIEDDKAEVFGADQIWLIDKTHKSHKGAIALELARKGLDAFAVEINSLENASKEEINRCVDSLIRVFKFKGLEIKRHKPMLVRLEIKAEKKGIFISIAKPMQKVCKGEVLGKIICEDETITVKSTIVGEVMQVSKSKICKENDFLVSVGELK